MFKKNTKKIVFIYSLVFILQGCMSTDIAQYSEIDQSDKTITLQAGNRGILGKLKQGFTQRGWKFTFDRGPNRTVGTSDGKVDVESFNTFKTRYRLFVDWNRYDYCLNFQPMISYDIVMIDNSTGSEVISLSGNECESNAVKKFFKAIDKN